MLKSDMTYSSFDTLLNIVILFSTIILLLRYLYEFDFISLTGSLRMIYFSLAFIISIGFFLFSFICMSESKEKENYKQSRVIMFLFFITVISFCYIYLFDENILNNNFKEFEIPVHSFEGTYDKKLIEHVVSDIDSVDSVQVVDSFQVVDSVQVLDSVQVVDPDIIDLAHDVQPISEEHNIQDDIIIEKVNYLIQQKQI